MPLVIAALLLSAPVAAQPQSHDDQDILDLSLAELINLEVTSASRSRERVIDAPATVIVITGDDLIQRGYRDLSEIYNDLPGMDLSRSYGDTYYRNQWRGLRKNIGTPYLLMLDGNILNHLYFNQEEILATLPLSNIEQVEIVYGPGSAVYGPNAFVGVINVITRKNTDLDGHHFKSRISAGSLENRIADFHYLYKSNDWRFSLAGRLDDGRTDQGQLSSYEWTRPEYLENRNLWGGLVDHNGLDGKGSAHRNRALDLRIFHGAHEFALQYFTLDAQLGNIYAGDLMHMRSRWIEPELSAYYKQTFSAGAHWTGSAVLRYRQSNVDPDSASLESFNVSNPDTQEVQRMLSYARWASDNSSLALNIDTTYQNEGPWMVLTGLKIKGKDLQRAYRITYGPNMPVNQVITPDDYPIPSAPDADTLPNNRISTLDTGAYALAKYRAENWWGHGESHALLAGVRYDHNSEYGLARTLRGGYVLNLARWTAKLLYGEAFNEPAARELYGCWGGSGCNPNLSPETAQTLEASLSYQHARYTVTASAYQLESANNITTFAGGARNLGDRTIRGLDIHLTTRIPIGGQTWTAWGYYSYTQAHESVPGNAGHLFEQPVGDTSPHKLNLGITWPINERLTATLRGRHIDARNTVASNPVGKVSSFSTFDFTLLQQQWPAEGFGWSLSIYNLGNRTYFHPGLREGNAGMTPGFMNAQGVWQGSGGYYNSLLPQEGRSMLLSFLVDF